MVPDPVPDPAPGRRPDGGCSAGRAPSRRKALQVKDVDVPVRLGIELRIVARVAGATVPMAGRTLQVEDVYLVVAVEVAEAARDLDLDPSIRSCD